MQVSGLEESKEENHILTEGTGGLHKTVAADLKTRLFEIKSEISGELALVLNSPFLAIKTATYKSLVLGEI